jgi:hypothetical protein
MKYVFYGLVAFGFAAIATAIAVLDKQSDTLHYRGDVDQTFVNQIKSFPANELKTIVITSGGGSVSAAIDAANLMQDHEIKLVVDDYCVSACASILLATSQRNIIREDSIVGFHRPIGLIYFLNEYLGREHSVSLEGSAQYELSKQAIAIYERAGIKPELFVATSIRQGFGCLDGDFKQRLERGENFQLHFLADLYIPNEKVLKQFGWNFEQADFPEDQEFALLEDKIFNVTNLQTLKIEDVNYEWPEGLISPDLRLTRVDLCE